MKTNEQSGIDGALEKKWREEFYNYAENVFSLDYRFDPYSNEELCYLEACRARQSEVEAVRAEIAKRDELLREALVFLPTEYVNRDEWKYKAKAILKEKVK